MTESRTTTDQQKRLENPDKYFAFALFLGFGLSFQRELFLLEVNNRETITAIEENNDTYCLQKRIEKFPLRFYFLKFSFYP